MPTMLTMPTMPNEAKNDPPRWRARGAVGVWIALALTTGSVRAVVPADGTAVEEAAADSAESAQARVLELEQELRTSREERERELRAWTEERESLRGRVADLEAELVRLTEDQLVREQRWLDFTRAIASLTSDQLEPEELVRILGGPRREEHSEPPEAASGDASTPVEQLGPESSAREAARRAREREIALALRSLLVAEQVDGMELLEAGELENGAMGPVVFRLADAWGRPLGSLAAERLRLEGSRSGRTTTIVLEAGCERRGGERFPFSGSERRIVLPGVDPAPWIEACPELFTSDAHLPVLDDGRWNTTLVQAGLNELLRQDAAHGYYRLSAFGGVLEGALCDVQIDEHDAADRLQRRLFADRLTIEIQAQGVLLLLEDGVQMRGGRRLAFLDGRYRIFLPRAEHAEWRAMGLPGLALPKDSPLARNSTALLPPELRPGAAARRSGAQLPMNGRR